jgi:hypothetical protein
MSKAKTAIIATVIALVIEGVCTLSLTFVGGDGPGNPFAWVGIILLFPATMLATLVGGLSGYGGILIAVFGFLEFFIPSWFIIRRKYGRNAA